MLLWRHSSQRRGPWRSWTEPATLGYSQHMSREGCSVVRFDSARSSVFRRPNMTKSRSCVHWDVWEGKAYITILWCIRVSKKSKTKMRRVSNQACSILPSESLVSPCLLQLPSQNDRTPTPYMNALSEDCRLQSLLSPSRPFFENSFRS